MANVKLFLLFVFRYSGLNIENRKTKIKLNHCCSLYDNGTIVATLLYVNILSEAFFFLNILHGSLQLKRLYYEFLLLLCYYLF